MKDFYYKWKGARKLISRHFLATASISGIFVFPLIIVIMHSYVQVSLLLHQYSIFRVIFLWKFPVTEHFL